LATGICTATRTPPTDIHRPTPTTAVMKKADNYSLLAHNTFGIKAQARHFWEFSTVQELQETLASQPIATAKHLVIGQGSNLLFLNDYEGIVLHSAIKGIEVEHEDAKQISLRVGSGETWDDLVACCARNGWSGIENLSGIPGEVGAAAVQNIGAYGVEACDCIEKVEALSLADGTLHVFPTEACGYSYRNSIFKQAEKGRYFITHVYFLLEKGGQPRLSYQGLSELLPKGTASSLQEVREAVLTLRTRKLPDPAEWGNAGSFFMNPVVPDAQYEALKQQYPSIPSYKAGEGMTKIPAAWLIEQCGWKGRALGKAAVWERQPLVLINRGGATADEITRLAQQIVADVQTKFGITLHPEVNYIA
jgi:UDP-N-acetylmuramate dehydrogenase